MFLELDCIHNLWYSDVIVNDVYCGAVMSVMCSTIL